MFSNFVSFLSQITSSQRFRSSQNSQSQQPPTELERLENELELLRASHETALRNGYDLRDEQARMRDINTQTIRQLQDEITTMRASIRTPNDLDLDRVLPQDSFSFIMVAQACSMPFNFGMFIYVFQIATFSLVTLDLLSSGDGSNNVFGIPGDVTAQLRASQFIAILVAVRSKGLFVILHKAKRLTSLFSLSPPGLHTKRLDDRFRSFS